MNDNYNITSAAAYGSHGIRPSLYLSSSIKIIGGDGGEAPFKLAM